MLKHVGSLVMVFGLTCAATLWSQGGVATERSATDSAFDEPTAMNVAQKASLSFGSAKRQLNQAAKFEAKIEAESNEGKRAKLETKRTKALQSAVAGFREGLSYNVKAIEGWAGLGTAYRALGQYQEALLAHVEGMKVDAEDQTNFVGWTQAAMDGLLFGQVTAAHGRFATENPPFATVMLDLIKQWVAERRTEPGNVNPADLDRLEAWIAEQSS